MVVSHYVSLSLRWPLITVVSIHGCLSIRWSLITVVSHRGGLSSRSPHYGVLIDLSSGGCMESAGLHSRPRRLIIGAHNMLNTRFR